MKFNFNFWQNYIYNLLLYVTTIKQYKEILKKTFKIIKET